MSVEMCCSKTPNNYINALNVNLTADELRFIQDNCFYNLKIQQINNETVAHIYDEIVKLIEFYRLIDAYALVDFATGIEDKLFDFIPWENFEENKENDSKISLGF